MSQCPRAQNGNYLTNILLYFSTFLSSLPAVAEPTSLEDCLTCPDNPDHKCGHSTVDSFVSVQKSTRLFSTNGAVSMEMNKIDRAPKTFFAVENFTIGDFTCTPFSLEACNDEQWSNNKPLPPLELSFDYGDGSPIKCDNYEPK